MSGILRLSELVFKALDGDINFDGTVYDGARIIEMRTDMPFDPVQMKSEGHPAMMRHLVTADYLRVRLGYGAPGYVNLIEAIKNKLLANGSIADAFSKNIREILNPDDPFVKDGVTTSNRWIGIQGKGWVSTPRATTQHEEWLPVHLWIFQNDFSNQAILTGD